MRLVGSPSFRSLIAEGGKAILRPVCFPSLESEVPSYQRTMASGRFRSVRSVGTAASRLLV
jgi:hypothetical protein